MAGPAAEHDAKMGSRRGSPCPTADQLARLGQRLDSTSISFGIPSYNEGRGIRHTLDALGTAIDRLRIPGPKVILSDSSTTVETVQAAEEWARSSSIDLLIDRSVQRRTSKEARNVIMARATSDVLVQMDADVVVPVGSLYHMLSCLCEQPRSAVVIGSTTPDPHYRAMRYRASAWQLKAVRRYASWLPADAIRAEAAFWGAWRSFYSEFRFAPGEGAPVDDVDLAKHLHDNNIPTSNCWRATADKVPAGTLQDFYLQTQRGYAASGSHQRTLHELSTALIEAMADPIGAVLYARARAWAALQRRKRTEAWDEHWEVEQSTKRR